LILGLAMPLVYELCCAEEREELSRLFGPDAFRRTTRLLRLRAKQRAAYEAALAGLAPETLMPIRADELQAEERRRILERLMCDNRTPQRERAAV